MGSESSNRKVNGHRSSVREKFMVDLFSPSVMSVRELLKKAHEMTKCKLYRSPTHLKI